MTSSFGKLGFGFHLLLGSLCRVFNLLGTKARTEWNMQVSHGHLCEDGVCGEQVQGVVHGSNSQGPKRFMSVAWNKKGD